MAWWSGKSAMSDPCRRISGSPVFMPMNVLRIDANQRYNTKLSYLQTSNMINFTVTVVVVSKPPRCERMRNW